MVAGCIAAIGMAACSGEDGGSIADAGSNDSSGDEHFVGDAADDAVTIDASRDVTRQDASGDGITDEWPQGDASTDATTASSCVSIVVGPAGATLSHPDGAKLVVPSRALAAATQLSLCAQSDPTTGMLGGVALGRVFQAGPDGQTFSSPVQVLVPFDSTLLPVGSDLNTVQLRTAPQGTMTYGALQSSVDLATGLVQANTTHFSQFVAAQTLSPVFITSPSSLAQATVGNAYSQQFSASGGTPPYAWSTPSTGALPPGLSVSSAGVLAGTPVVPNNYSFFVAVSDSVGTSVQLAISLTVVPANNPVPSIARLAPSTIVQGTGDSVVGVSGVDFVPNSDVLWDGAALPTTFVSPSQLYASIPAVKLLDGGMHRVSVFSPSPGGGTSGTLTLTVTPAQLNPLPSIASVAPLLLPISAIDTQIAITGGNFIPSSSALVGPQAIATRYISQTQLAAAVPAAYLHMATTLAIGVRNPPPGGGTSATSIAVAIGTLNPTPVITGLSPPSVIAGSGPFVLNLLGNGFVPRAQAFFGSTALATDVSSATTAHATVPGYLVANLGDVPVVLVNPTPGGGASGGFTFSIRPPSDGRDSGGTNTDEGGVPGASCLGLAATCGPSAAENCCASNLVTGGTYNRSNNSAHPATVSDFRLDKYEITVGRFRKFVAAYSPTMTAAGAGKNPNNAGDPGWNPAWNATLPADAAALKAAVNCDAAYQTWTDDVSSNESLPMNCMDWYEAYAFCIWDGGRLPTEAEWNYAAAGGNEQRRFPWGATLPDCSYANYWNDATSSACVPPGLANRVGSESPKGDSKWGQSDLAGNLWEWVLDWLGPYVDPCVDCANFTMIDERAGRGGSFYGGMAYMDSSYRNGSPYSHDYGWGARCARSP